MTLQEIQYKAQRIIHKWRDDDSAPYIEFVEELAHMIVQEPSDDLEEAAQKFADMEYMVGDVDRSALYKGFWHGAKWQEEQDLKYISEIHRNGYNLCKEQMMNKAMEGEVVKDISNKLAVTAKINLDGFKFGDKVRVIIVKED